MEDDGVLGAGVVGDEVCLRGACKLGPRDVGGETRAGFGCGDADAEEGEGRVFPDLSVGVC